MSEGVWGRPESPHSQPMIYQSIKNNVVYYKIEEYTLTACGVRQAGYLHGGIYEGASDKRKNGRTC